MPKISPELRSQRRRRLMAAAQRRIAAHGYRDTTVDDVCAEAGVSKGAFYGYFETKHDLLLALLEEETVALLDVICELAGAEPATPEGIRRFTHAMLRVGDDPSRVQLRADLWAAMASDPVVRDAFAATVDRRRARLRSWIAGGIAGGQIRVPDEKANALASILLALADGLMLHRGLDQRGFRWENIRAVLDLMLTGLERPQPGAGTE